MPMEKVWTSGLSIASVTTWHHALSLRHRHHTLLDRPPPQLRPRGVEVYWTLSFFRVRLCSPGAGGVCPVRLGGVPQNLTLPTCFAIPLTERNPLPVAPFTTPFLEYV